MSASEAQLQLRTQDHLLAILPVLQDASNIGKEQHIGLIDREIEIGRPLEIVSIHVVVDPQGQHP